MMPKNESIDMLLSECERLRDELRAAQRVSLAKDRALRYAIGQFPVLYRCDPEMFDAARVSPAKRKSRVRK
jgi:hypothetical protein